MGLVGGMLPLALGTDLTIWLHSVERKLLSPKGHPSRVCNRIIDFPSSKGVLQNWKMPLRGRAG